MRDPALSGLRPLRLRGILPPYAREETRPAPLVTRPASPGEIPELATEREVVQQSIVAGSEPFIASGSEPLPLLPDERVR